MRTIVVCGILIILSLGFFTNIPLNADTTFTVTTTSDEPDDNLNDDVCDTASGGCSLRAAIEQANATAGADTIHFNIPGSGTRWITMSAIGPGIFGDTVVPLPPITESLIIDGTTQPGFNGTPLIGIDGNDVGLVASNMNNGLTFSGGTGEVRGMLIGNFDDAGIGLLGGSDHTVAGNYIGTNGVDEIYPVDSGIYVASNNNTIGGTTEADRNIISGSVSVSLDGGVHLAGDNNVVQGNYIGTDVTGTYAIGNYNGVYISDSDGNLIGGTTAAARNIISGNYIGVAFSSDIGINTLQGNYIGTDVSGSQAVPNTFDGVTSIGTGSILIGGTATGAGNVISGNGTDGLTLFGSGIFTVQGNFVGTNAAGTAALPNAGSGIDLGSRGVVVIGGTAAGAGNVISGNDGDGIIINTSTVNSNLTIQGNYIGLDATGISPIGNGRSGIATSASYDPTTVLIGGTEPGAGNYITGNDDHGIIGPDDQMRIEGNIIGLNVNGQAIGNGDDGIRVRFFNDDAFIGGIGAGQGNVIAGNAGAGIYVFSTLDGVAARGNHIYANGGIAFDLGPGTGPTFNDVGDGDSDGANQLQNYPIITAATVANGQITVSGTLNTTPLKTYEIDLYTNTACDASGYGEGEFYLGTITNVTTDASGNAAFSMSLPYSGGIEIAGAALDINGNMSEIGPCRTVQGGTTGTLIERIAPADEATMGNDSYVSQFQFVPLSGVEWYQVWVGTDASTNYSTTYLFEWFPASVSSTGNSTGMGICEGHVCSIPVDLWFIDGNYSWWMTYWGPNNPNINDYWHESTFSVDFDAPSVTVTYTGPADMVTVSAPDEITWNRDPNVLWYHLWVGSADYTNQVYFDWLDATNECDATTCILNVSDLTFPAGEYEIWTEVWGPNGYLTWTQVNTGAPSTFMVDTP